MSPNAEPKRKALIKKATLNYATPTFHYRFTARVGAIFFPFRSRSNFGRIGKIAPEHVPSLALFRARIAQRLFQRRPHFLPQKVYSRVKSRAFGDDVLGTCTKKNPTGPPPSRCISLSELGSHSLARAGIASSIFRFIKVKKRVGKK